MTTIAQPSVQSLRIEMLFGDQLLSSSTAFVCRAKKGPVLMTNWHNVTGRHHGSRSLLSSTGAIPDRIRVTHNHSSGIGRWLSVVEPLFMDGAPRWLEHPTLGDKVDFVALPLTNLTDVALYPYDHLALPRVFVGPAETVSVVGFPFSMKVGGSLAVWATGFVASEPQVDIDELPKFLVDCRTRPGQSGSAVIAYRAAGFSASPEGFPVINTRPVADLLGIYSGRVNAESDLGIVWKTSAITNLLEIA